MQGAMKTLDEWKTAPLRSRRWRRSGLSSGASGGTDADAGLARAVLFHRIADRGNSASLKKEILPNSNNSNSSSYGIKTTRTKAVRQQVFSRRSPNEATVADSASLHKDRNGGGATSGLNQHSKQIVTLANYSQPDAMLPPLILLTIESTKNEYEIHGIHSALMAALCVAK